MKVVFRIIGSEEDIKNLKGNEENVHFCFRPSERNIFDLLAKCPKLKRIQLPQSYHATLSSTAKMLLSMKGIQGRVGDVWGHRTDIEQTAEVEIED